MYMNPYLWKISSHQEEGELIFFSYATEWTNDDRLSNFQTHWDVFEQKPFQVEWTFHTNNLIDGQGCYETKVRSKDGQRIIFRVYVGGPQKD